MPQAYSENENGRTFELTVNDWFDLMLNESRMGGYRCKLVDDGTPVLKSEELQGSIGDVSVPGGRQQPNLAIYRSTAGFSPDSTAASPIMATERARPGVSPHCKGGKRLTPGPQGQSAAATVVKACPVTPRIVQKSVEYW
jgi:hypothetical protein